MNCVEMIESLFDLLSRNRWGVFFNLLSPSLLPEEGWAGPAPTLAPAAPSVGTAQPQSQLE